MKRVRSLGPTPSLHTIKLYCIYRASHLCTFFDPYTVKEIAKFLFEAELPSRFEENKYCVECGCHINISTKRRMKRRCTNCERRVHENPTATMDNVNYTIGMLSTNQSLYRNIMKAMDEEGFVECVNSCERLACHTMGVIWNFKTITIKKNLTILTDCIKIHEKNCNCFARCVCDCQCSYFYHRYLKRFKGELSYDDTRYYYNIPRTKKIGVKFYNPENHNNCEEKVYKYGERNIDI